VIVIGADRSRQEYTDFSLYDDTGNSTEAFDLGGRLEVALDQPLADGDALRLVTTNTVIYSGEI